MKKIKFTTDCEQVLSFSDKNFKIKYEERIGNNKDYVQVINGEPKHLALCPLCNNAVVILGVYKKIDVAPHARHARGVNIPKVSVYDEYSYLHCPYHVKNASYIREYVPETEEPQRREIYKTAKEHFDKAVYLLEKETGIKITKEKAEELAKNYAAMRVYNYIGATAYNIPWYLIYGFDGFPIHHIIVRKDTALCKHLAQYGFKLRDSKTEGHVYADDDGGHLLRATDYRYSVDKNEDIKEYLDFSVMRPDDEVEDTLLYVPVYRFSISLDTYYFGNLINYKSWKPRKNILDIADKYMKP